MKQFIKNKLRESLNKLLKENYSYNSGDCDIYAISLHKLYNYPIYVVRGFYIDELDNEEYYEDCHMVVKKPNNLYLDSRGEFTENELKQDCLFSNKITKIEILAISEKEAKHCFSISGYSEEDLEKTIKFIKSKNS